MEQHRCSDISDFVSELAKRKIIVKQKRKEHKKERKDCWKFHDVATTKKRMPNGSQLYKMQLLYLLN